MPVINAPEVMTVAKAIAAGVIDIKAPYGDDVKTKMESYYQMRRGLKPLNESVVKILRDYNKKNQKRLQESYIRKIAKERLNEKSSTRLRGLLDSIVFENLIKKKTKKK